ncbi:monovalent cation/H(+) antiporter subunit G [Chelatococcus composti]|jgi:monovalent cation/proton antiporter, MnhG/PhaG subunit|uniref:Multicomponent K+:H+ antiporter subunit G n=2 Tax=Pseudomonadota TaxID=1224 RepID=A0A841KDS2_9HYPH|nr:monovalent cation/H(+) antiporter subunit G [Chelatococcus composti]MBB6169512.1 multicomponent K+:H+ antiporter subunit G [Chelatococcus composti]MBS7736097.1 monovalent cation/H(+) antiporter subunit G [Chelatococcus composti]PZN44838.1 MAG: cation:proton antiporter [Pseudomonadota bacterium]GGG48284.1 potassium efflux system protein [Chelatococcus composti]
MSHAAELPVWAALLTSLLLLVGAGLTLLGAVGVLQFRSFFERVHAPTLGTSWGTGAIALASIVFFSSLGTRLVVHEVLIGVFITVTTPVTLMLLARAALHRERAEENPNVPSRAVMRRRGSAPAPEDGAGDAAGTPSS